MDDAARRLGIPLWGRTLIKVLFGVLTCLVAVLGFLFQQFYSFKNNVDSQLSSLRTDVAKIQGEMQRIPTAVSQKLIDQSARAAATGKANEAARSLALAASLIETAKEQKINPGSAYFDHVSAQLGTVAKQRSSREVSDLTRRTFTALAAYRSSLEPEPQLVGPQKPIDTSIRTTISTRMNVRILFGATVFPVWVHGDVFRSTAPPTLSSNVVIEGPAVFLGMVPDASQTLDGIHWIDGVTFVNMRIRYKGGEVELRSVRFVNCTFELADSPLGIDMASAIAMLNSSVVLKQGHSG